MQIFKEFGVNPVLLIAQIVNFLIILVVLKKFMYKPVLKMLKERQDTIEEGLKNAENAEKKLIEAEAKETEVLRKAQEKADKILSDAKAEAASLKSEAEEAARTQAETMLTQAREQINQETQAAEERLTKNIGTIAISLLERSLVGVFGAKEQKIILQKAQEQISKNRP